jgi:hypothetical protein
MSWSPLNPSPSQDCHAAIDIPAALSPSTTALSAPAILYGENGSITVTVTSGAETPTGNVSLSVDGGTPLTQALSGGATVFTIAGLHVGNHNLSASYAAQGTFGASSASGTVTVLSYSQATTNLQAQVDAAGLPQGTQNSLDSKLQAALASFNQGDTTAAKNQLGAFINEVGAQRGKKIDAPLADALIAYAQRVINAVG